MHRHFALELENFSSFLNFRRRRNTGFLDDPDFFDDFFLAAGVLFDFDFVQFEGRRRERGRRNFEIVRVTDAFGFWRTGRRRNRFRYDFICAQKSYTWFTWATQLHCAARRR